jgi:hypothetical protein
LVAELTHPEGWPIVADAAIVRRVSASCSAEATRRSGLYRALRWIASSLAFATRHD